MGWLDAVVQWVTGLMDTIGGLGVLLAILLENVFPPIPSEIILPLAGFTAAQPDAPYNLIQGIMWATAGSVGGALLLYGVGRAFGVRRIRAIADRMPLVDGEDMDKAMDWFHRHGRGAVFTGRLVPGVRSLISVPAGVVRMPIPIFVAFTTAGSALWNTVLVVAGYALGENWHVVSVWMDRFSTVVHVILALLVVALLVWLVRRAIRRKRATDPQAARTPSSTDSHGQ